MANKLQRAAQAVKTNGISGLGGMVAYGVQWRLRRLRRRFPVSDSMRWSASSSQSSIGRISHDLSLPPAQERLLNLASELPEVAEQTIAADLSVAIIVPTFDDLQFLESALLSIQQQTHTAWTCYVIDDAGPSDIASIVAPFAASDDRFVLVRHAANAGLAAARNTGLRLANEDLIQFLDADDMLTPWALARRVLQFRTKWDDPTIAGCYGQIQQCPEETQLDDVSTWLSTPNLPDVDWLTTVGESPFNVHAPLVRRSVLLDLGGFDETFVNGAEDWELWQRILRHGFRFSPSPCVVGAYRQRRSSMIRSFASTHLDRANQLMGRSAQWAVVQSDVAVSNAKMPIGDALDAHTRLLRAAVFAGIRAAHTGSVESAVTSEILDFLRPAHSMTTRFAEVRQRARAGMTRGLGLAPQNLDHLDRRARALLEGAAEEIARTLLGHIRTHASAGDDCDGGMIDMTNRQTFDVAIVAETLADIEPLRAAAEVLSASGLTVVAVDISAADADQGSTEGWASTGIATVGFNTVALGATRCRSVLGRVPVGPTTLELLQRASEFGTIGRLLADDVDRNLVLDESPGAHASSAIERCTPRELIEALGHHDESATGVWAGSDFVTRLPREEGPLHAPSSKRLLELRNAHLGETAVIIGNGPSLNDTDLELLRGVSTFGVNSIFLADERLPEPLTYYVVEDSAVFRDNTEAVMSYQAGTKLFPTNYLPEFRPEEITENTLFFRMNGGFYGRDTGTLCHPRFSFDLAQRAFCGQSVTIINLQLAYWLGYQRVVLIGMDFSYTIPDDAEVNGNIIVSRSDDPNHFHPDYFGAGKTWKDPHLDRVLANYRLADEIYRAGGREIVNATVGGKLEVFPRMTLAEAVRPVRPTDI